MAIWAPMKLIDLSRNWLPCSSSPASTSAVGVATSSPWKKKKKKNKNLIYCAPLQQNPHSQQKPNEEEDEEGIGIMCEPCNGRGWLLCGFCEGQKTNVKAANNRIYRRCPDCKAIGYILCSKCKVFKCVTYPDFSDGEL